MAEQFLEDGRGHAGVDISRRERVPQSMNVHMRDAQLRTPPAHDVLNGTATNPFLALRKE